MHFWCDVGTRLWWTVCRQRPLWDLRVCTCLAITSRFSVQINSLSHLSACISNLIICLQFVCAFQHGNKEWTHWLIIDYANREGWTRCNIWCVLLYIIYNMVKLHFLKIFHEVTLFWLRRLKGFHMNFLYPCFHATLLFWVTWVCFLCLIFKDVSLKKTRLIYETSLCIFLQLWCAATCCLPVYLQHGDSQKTSIFRLVREFLWKWHFSWPVKICRSCLTLQIENTNKCMYVPL